MEEINIYSIGDLVYLDTGFDIDSELNYRSKNQYYCRSISIITGFDENNNALMRNISKVFNGGDKYYEEESPNWGNGICNWDIFYKNTNFKSPLRKYIVRTWSMNRYFNNYLDTSDYKNLSKEEKLSKFQEKVIISANKYLEGIDYSIGYVTFERVSRVRSNKGYGGFKFIETPEYPFVNDELLIRGKAYDLELIKIALNQNRDYNF